jgi:hypothetical protein
VTGAGTPMLGAHSLYRPALWMFCCGFLFIQMNTEYVRLAMHRA